MASSSTEISPEFFDRVSLGLVGRVGKAHAVICSGVTAIRSKVMSASLARGMLKDIRVATTSIVCSGCGSDFTARCNPLAAWIVLVPRGPERDLIGGGVCRRCLNRGAVLKVTASSFAPILPGGELELIH